MVARLQAQYGFKLAVRSYMMSNQHFSIEIQEGLKFVFQLRDIFSIKQEKNPRG